MEQPSESGSQAARHEREAQFLQALAHPARLRIVELLSDRERCGCDIEPLFGIGQSTISRHLQVLKRAEIVWARKEGVRVLYRLRDEDVLVVCRRVADLISRHAEEDLGSLIESDDGGGSADSGSR